MAAIACNQCAGFCSIPARLQPAAIEPNLPLRATNETMLIQSQSLFTPDSSFTSQIDFGLEKTLQPRQGKGTKKLFPLCPSYPTGGGDRHRRRAEGVRRPAQEPGLEGGRHHQRGAQARPPRRRQDLNNDPAICSRNRGVWGAPVLPADGTIYVPFTSGEAGRGRPFAAPLHAAAEQQQQPLRLTSSGRASAVVAWARLAVPPGTQQQLPSRPFGARVSSSSSPVKSPQTCG